MCFGSPEQPDIPTPPALPPPVSPPPPPINPAPAPEALQDAGSRPGIQLKRNRREAQGAVSKGTGALRIPLNTGSSSSGGLNI